MKLTATDLEFIGFLESTLIPDLKESGNTSTAADFEKCVRIMLRLGNGKEVPEGGMKVTVSLDKAQVRGLKSYLTEVSHDIDPKIRKEDIEQEISEIVHGTLQSPTHAVSDHIQKFAANGN